MCEEKEVIMEHISRETIIDETFDHCDINDPFFDSLKEDYEGFVDWFARKAKARTHVLIQRDDSKYIQAFLYLKIEEGEVNDVEPVLPPKKRLKIGTFKINGHNTRLGERFFKKIFDYAIRDKVEEVYVTIFNRPMQAKLIETFYSFGFEEKARKGEELVLLKNMHTYINNPTKDYPLIALKDRNKYVLSIYPQWHTLMFPDSALYTERYDPILDVSPTNSIHKIYITSMIGTENLKRGDIIVIYRSSDRDGQAWYRSVYTSICVVEEVKRMYEFIDREDMNAFIKDYSIFPIEAIDHWFSKRNSVIIKMTYNVALEKRITLGTMIQNLDLHPKYYGFYSLSDEQFINLVRLGNANEDYFVH